MENNSQILEIIKTTAIEYISDAEIMLFGSRARKNFKIDSDYDILIVTEQNLSAKEKIPFKTNIRKSLLKSGIRSDILIQSKDEMKYKGRLPGHIIRNILNEAILL